MVDNGSAFTIKSTVGLLRVLACDIVVQDPSTKQSISLKAIWDTGATASVISLDIVKKLGLIPTGKVLVSTANGVVPQNTYITTIGLPNGATFINVVVTEVQGLSGGADALIGMDIINFGDFSITNHNKITCMSFRTPTLHEIDYTKEPNLVIEHQ